MKRVNKFCKQQLNDIASGGVKIFFRKCYALFGLILALPCVIVARLLRPVILIRFGQLWSSRIGHFAINTELYLCQRDLEDTRERTLDLFYHTPIISNYQLKKMWERTLLISPLVRWLDRVNKLIPGYNVHTVPINESRDFKGLLSRTRPHLYFLPKEAAAGYKALEEMGIPKGSSFVCFHARGKLFLDKAHSNTNWRYHDYRNTDIINYLSAVEELTDQGYFAVRTGAFVEKALDSKNPKIIDYAFKFRSDFLDVFLSAKCSFYIVDTAGVYALPLVFRKPVVSVNIIPLSHAPRYSESRLFIPKKLWLKDERRFLTFKEILSSSLSNFYTTEEFKKAGVEVVENTGEEIAALSREMDKRLKGKWEVKKEDERLQELFISFFKPNEGKISRIGTEFLHENKELLK